MSKISNFFKHRTIASKYILIMIFICFLLMLVNSGINIYKTYFEFEKKLIQEGNSILNSTKSILKEPIWNIDKESINSYCSVLLKNEYVREIFLRDNTNEIKVNLSKNIINDGLLIKSETIYFESDIVKDSLIIGQVRIGLSKEVFIHQMINKLKSESFSLIIVLIFLSSAVFFATKKITKPLKTLEEAMERFGEGDFVSRVHIESNDEIGRMSKKFNEMATRILENFDKIKLYEESENMLLKEIQLQLKIREQEREILVFVENTSDIFLKYDLTGNITYVRGRYDKLGYSDRDLLGKNLFLFIAEEEHFKIQLAFQDAIQGKNYLIDVKLLSKNGCIFEFECGGSSVLNESGEVFEVIIILRDITERKKFERELIDAKNLAEQANISKSRFLANMSHEIRTPINGIMGFLQLLKFTKLDEEQQDFVKESLTSSELLLNIINDILMISKVEAGKLKIEKVDFNLMDAVHEVAKVAKIQCDDKNLAFHVELDEKFNNFFIGDVLRIKQVLNNMLSNAIKFTHHGQITLSVTLKKVLEPNYEFEFSVIDTGIGIKEAELIRLFKPFSQVDDSSTRNFGGTGLGLSISKQLAKLMDGDMSVESEYGKGSCFKLNLTFAKSDENNILNFSSDSFEKSIVKDSLGLDNNHHNILIVDDNMVNLKLVKKFMDNMHIHCILAENGFEAMEALKNNEISLILMDCNMPVMNGFETTEAIRKLDGSVKDTPIIAVTACVMPGDKEKCIESGMNDFITKPFTFENLSELVYKYLDK